jgi:hypothetical protein
LSGTFWSVDRSHVAVLLHIGNDVRRCWMISRTPTLAQWPYRMVRLACDHGSRRRERDQNCEGREDRMPSDTPAKRINRQEKRAESDMTLGPELCQRFQWLALRPLL